VKVSSCKIEGDGLAFVHSGGTMAKELKAGEVLKVDTAASSVLLKMWIMISSSSAESKLYFGGEGLFCYTSRSEPFIYNHYL
jgi:uncharacterized protein (AIM24 family)